MKDKTCTTCNETKPIEEFGKNGSRGTNFRSNAGTARKAVCKVCTALAAKAWRKANPNYHKNKSNKINKYVVEDKLLISAIGSRLIDAKQRIKNLNQIPTDLDRDWLFDLYKKQEGKCALSGVSLVVEKGTPLTLSLDKIDPSKGYVKGNVQWLCWAVNRAKGDLHTEDFVDMCQSVVRKCND